MLMVPRDFEFPTSYLWEFQNSLFVFAQRDANEESILSFAFFSSRRVHFLCHSLV